MKEELSEAQRMIIDQGFAFISVALGYKEGDLKLESRDGTNLSLEIGMALQEGEISDETKGIFIDRAKELIRRNHWQDRGP